MRVLIVDKEKEERKFLKELLMSVSGEGHVFAEAADGSQALEMVQTWGADAVFMDIWLPYIDGLTVIKAARARGLGMNFVIVSACKEFEAAKEAISLDVTEYLVKPLALSDVERAWGRLNRVGIQAKANARKYQRLKDRYPQAHPLVIKALKIIESSYTEKISQKELAKTLGISAEYFSFLFRRDVGAGFSRFLRAYRIEEAKVFISTGEVPLESIPYKVGFSDPKYFSRCFKEETGMSLTQYIRELKP